jgi:hypothetical protein
MYPTFVHHQHEHGMTGSIAVDPQRAVAAFTLGLAAIDALAENYADKIAAEEKAIADAEEEMRVKYEKEKQECEKQHAEQMAYYKAQAERRKAAEETIRILELKDKNSWWFLSKEDRAALKKAKINAKINAKQYETLPFPSYPHRYSRRQFIESPRQQIAELRASVEPQLAQCAVALDCSHLTPGWAANVYRMEQGDWAEKQYPFNRYAKGE